MNVNEFINYIRMVGFNSNGIVWIYKSFEIFIYPSNGAYEFFNPYKNSAKRFSINDIKPINNNFKMETRGIKLKKLLE